MINPDVIAHLEKYFKLSRTYFAEDDYALAAFFAITTIEETAKVLMLEGRSLQNIEGKKLLKEAHSHQSKYLDAMINLIDQNPQYESFPPDWKREVDSWWDTNKLMKIRNNSLYLRYHRNNQVAIPRRGIDIQLAALLVYVAGLSLAELDEYINGFPSGWKKSILAVTDMFRRQHLRE